MCLLVDFFFFFLPWYVTDPYWLHEEICMVKMVAERKREMRSPESVFYQVE